MIGIISILLLIIGAVIFAIAFKSEDYGIDLKITGSIIFSIGIIVFLICCFTIIDAGEVGIQVQFGKVQDSTLYSGFNFKSPFVSIEKWSIRLHESTMDVKDNTAIEAMTKDKLAVDIDATIWWKIIPNEVKVTYSTIATNEDRIDDTVVFPSIRSIVRDAVALFTFEDINNQRDSLSKIIDDKLIILLDAKGVKVDKVLMRNIIPKDPTVLNAIGQKLRQQQELQAKEFELQKVQKDKAIRITNAEGLAASQKIIDHELTPAYLQFEAIQMMKTLAGSHNTTFVFVPMSNNGSGLPMVWDMKNIQVKQQKAEK
jgi:prohibitin 1